MAGMRSMYLTDGGHFENIGIYSLIRRGCRFIIVADGEYDPGVNKLREMIVEKGNNDVLRPPEEADETPELLMEGFREAEKKIYADFGGVFVKEKDWRDKLATKGYFTMTVSNLPVAVTNAVGVVGAVGVEPVQVVYIKSSYFIDGDSANMMSFMAAQKASTKFPHDSTANQFYSEAQILSYRRLGYDIGMRASQEIANGYTRVRNLKVNGIDN
jgi:hypothetical protein